MWSLEVGAAVDHLVTLFGRVPLAHFVHPDDPAVMPVPTAPSRGTVRFFIAGAKLDYSYFGRHTAPFSGHAGSVADLSVAGGADPLLAQSPEGVEEPNGEVVIGVLDLRAGGIFAADAFFLKPHLVLAIMFGILTGAAGAGLAATALGQLTQHAWITPGRRAPARWLTSWRRRRWDRAYATVRTTLEAVAATRNADTTSPPPDHGLALKVAVAACTRICLVPANRPTWIGDRLRATDERIHRTYRLDLTAAWPRLWLLIPNPARTELTTAHDSYTAAARLTGWGLLYLAVGAWWPALLIAAVIGPFPIL